MIQRFVLSSVITVLCVAAIAQDKKVAIFDPAGSVNSAIKEIIREEMSSIIVNTGGYTVLERQLIDRVLEENRFQSGGLVDDSQVSEMGKRMGANFVFVSSITELGNANYYISCKMIDVQTARIERQKTVQSSRSETELIGVIRKTLGEMFNVNTLLHMNRLTDEKIAIFDPSGTVDKSYKEIIREEISGIIVNTGGYMVLERQLINKVLEENRFQSGGLVDDTQISEMGKRMGANLVFVTSITTMSGNNYYLSFKLIDVQTARIEKQRTAVTQRGSSELIDVVQKTVREMFDEATRATATKQPPTVSNPVVTKPAETRVAASSDSKLSADGSWVYQEFKILPRYEVRKLMVNTDALQIYNKGVSKNRNGNIWMIAGVCLIAGGGAVAVVQPFEWRYEYTEYPYHYYRYRDDELNLWVGAGMATAGIISTVSGVKLKKNGKKLIHRSVDMYNKGKSTANVEFDVNFTGNGVRLAIRF